MPDLVLGEFPHRRDRIRQRAERGLRIRRRLLGCFGAHAAGGDVQEATPIHGCRVDAHGVAAQDNIHGMICVLRNARLSREVVGRAQWDDAERRVAPVEAIHHFVEGAVATAGDHDVGAAVGRPRRVCRRISDAPRGSHLHRMPAIADPRDRLPQILPVGSGAMDDKGEMLAAHRRDGAWVRSTGGRNSRLPGRCGARKVSSRGGAIRWPSVRA